MAQPDYRALSAAHGAGGRAILGSYLSGINSRRLRGALSPLLRGAPLSKDAVSRLVGRLREEFEAWSARDLAEEQVRYLLLDGWYRGCGSGKSAPLRSRRSAERSSAGAASEHSTKSVRTALLKGVTPAASIARHAF